LRHRTSQLIGYAAVVVVTGAATLYVGFSFISATAVSQTKTRVQMALNAAWSALQQESALVQVGVTLAAQHDAVRTTVVRGSPAGGAEMALDALRHEHGLDYLIVVDPALVVISQNEDEQTGGLRLAATPVVRRALDGGIGVGTVLVDPANLEARAPELRERSFIELVETERARPSDRKAEDRGMLLEAAVPILGPDRSVRGLVVGGCLLNRRFELVDRIRAAIFGEALYDGKPLGTVTIFLDDVRVATNVVTAESVRAIGTRVSEEVAITVLDRGQRFGDRAFVVDEWYLSAYDPIHDPDGATIGILYVGLLERYYVDHEHRLTLKYLGVGLVAVLLTIGLAFSIASMARRPALERIVRATRELSKGALDTRVRGSSGSHDLQEIALAVNSMAESLQARTDQVERAAREIRQAYDEADEKNRAYLEMLGFVTHELKSPLASIVFAVGALRDGVMGKLTEQQLDLLKAAANSADYLSSTIANYLNMSRIEEGALRLHPETVDLRTAVVEPAIERLREMAADKQMRIEDDIQTGVELYCDPTLMVSVFQNLLSNAVKYGREGGTIRLTHQALDGSNTLAVFNEGTGFSPEQASRMFTKFTRFHAEHYDTHSGTGIGLFVTRMIVELHGGSIEADSDPGRWASFLIRLPRALPGRARRSPVS
jgi:signal transduction histidine kinase